MEDSDFNYIDLDFCNVSEKRNMKLSRDVYVIKFIDIENDFFTIDFNNEVELNDLNRIGG